MNKIKSLNLYQKIILFIYGDTTFGPYTAKEDPDAVPEDLEFTKSWTGVELWQGDEIIFRGGAKKTRDYIMLLDEDNIWDNLGHYYTTVNGIGREVRSDTSEQVAPSVSDILELMNGPELVHKGDWIIWLGGIFICIINAVTILFVEELFRWSLSFRIRNAHRAEASDWEIAERYICWTILTITALAVFIMGLL